MSWEATGLERKEGKSRVSRTKKTISTGWNRRSSSRNSLMKPTPKSSSKVDRSRTPHRRLRHRGPDQSHLDSIALDVFESGSSGVGEVPRDGDVVARFGSIEGFDEVEGSVDEGEDDGG